MGKLRRMRNTARVKNVAMLCDAAPPVLLSAVISAAGDTLVLTFSERIVRLNTTGTVSLAGSQASTTTFASGGAPPNGSTTITFFADTTIVSGSVETLTVGAGMCQDVTGQNVYGGITGFAVTNGSTVP